MSGVSASTNPTLFLAISLSFSLSRFAAQGLWGRGIYFADKASYSKNYSHAPANSQTNERPKAKKDELEMFLTRLIVGELPQMKMLPFQTLL